MRDFKDLELKGKPVAEKGKILEELHRISNDSTELLPDRYKALDIVYYDLMTKIIALENMRQTILAKQHDLQVLMLEQFKHTRLVRFMAKYGAEVAKGTMSPQAAKEWKMIEVKSGNGCYRFTEDSMSVYERECETCSTTGCKYHPNRDEKSSSSKEV